MLQRDETTTDCLIYFLISFVNFILRFFPLMIFLYSNEYFVLLLIIIILYSVHLELICKIFIE